MADQPIDALFTCPECKGKGTVTKYRAAGGGRIGCRTWSERCSKCYGTGYEPKRIEDMISCPLCGEVFSLEDMIAATLGIQSHTCGAPRP
jgi:DnaJ-class molecular chaperone